MASENETLADVLAWCRDIARSYRNAPATKIEIEGLKVCDYLDELANRIDAAAKREIPPRKERTHESHQQNNT